MNIVKADGTPLTAGELRAGGVYDLDLGHGSSKVLILSTGNRKARRKAMKEHKGFTGPTLQLTTPPKSA